LCDVEYQLPSPQNNLVCSDAHHGPAILGYSTQKEGAKALIEEEGENNNNRFAHCRPTRIGRREFHAAWKNADGTVALGEM
jgi:hypothetical protein